MNQALLGTDVKVGKVLTLISGYQNLATQLIRRLSTRRGTLFYDPNYGDDIRLFMNSPINNATLEQIKYTIKRQCEADPRIDNADVSATYSQSTLTLEVDIALTTFLGPFTLVISVDALTIELLTIS